MQHKPHPGFRNISIFFAFTLCILFLDFYSNTWQMADQKWFESHQQDCQSLVVGRMVKSRQDGIFSAGGLPGVGGNANFNRAWLTEEQVDYQYRTYFDGKGFKEYSPYLSQTGGQGIFFSILDKIISLPPVEKLKFFNALTALLTALFLGSIVVWFYMEFGFMVALFVAGSMLLSQWLTVFGRNLWWSIWGFYLPLVALMYYLRTRQNKPAERFWSFFILVFASVTAKYLVNGFEYITTTLIMMTVPLFYYAFINKWDRRQLLKGILTIAVSSGVAIILCLFILSSQIASAKGSFSDGFEHIVNSIEKRTQGIDRENVASLGGKSVSIIEVCARYMAGAYANLNSHISSSNAFISTYILKIHYLYLLAIFSAASAYVWFKARSGKDAHRDKTLVLVTWFSILAPLSWFIIFKEHSHEHFHLNYIVWQMPFTLFGFAVCGVAARRFIADKWRRNPDDLESVSEP